MYAFLLVASSLLCLIYAMLWWQARRARSLLRHLPRYPPLPIIGNIHQVLGNSKHLMKVLSDMSKIQDKNGKPFVILLGPDPYLVFSDADDVKAVTYTFTEKPYFYRFTKEYVGNGLVTAPADIWQRNVKKLGAGFTGSIVNGYLDVFNAQAQVLVQRLKVESGGKPFDILSKYLAYTTLETICQTALGVPRISENIVTEEYYNAFKLTLESFINRGKNIFLHLDWVYHLTSAYKEYKKSVAVLHNVSETVISKRTKEREALKNNGEPPKSNENGKTKFKSFLDILFELKDVDPSFTHEQMRNEVDTIILGGQETVATTIFFTMLVLGSRPDIQKKIYDEIKEIFGERMRPVEKEDLPRMMYTEAVINETLRLFPPFPAVVREADRDLELKSCTVPKNTGCIINVWGAGRLKRVWGEDAEEYRPERWLAEGAVPPHSVSFLPFSFGKRACIGRRYAMTILKTILAHCIRDLEFSSNIENLQLKIDVALKADSGHLIQLKLRE